MQQSIPPDTSIDETRPAPFFGLCSLAVLIGGPFFSLWFGERFQSHDGGGGSWGPVGPIIAIPTYAFVSAIGFWLGWLALKKDERYLPIAYLGIALNGLAMTIFAGITIFGFVSGLLG